MRPTKLAVAVGAAVMHEQFNAEEDRRKAHTSAVLNREQIRLQLDAEDDARIQTYHPTKTVTSATSGEMLTKADVLRILGLKEKPL